MTRMPAHVKQAIETRLGAPMRYAHGTFHPDQCPTCGVWTLYGLDGWMVRLDPTPLTSPLEQAAVLLGRWTYQLVGTPGDFTVNPRHSPNRPIWAGAPQPGPECVVVPEHICHRPFLADPIPITKPKPAPIPDNAKPPY